MATITTKTTVGSTELATIITSGAADPTDVVDLSDIGDDLAHWFLGVQMFNATGVQISGSAGSFAVQVGTVVNGILEAPPQDSITASAPVTIDWAGNTRRVVVTPTGLTGVTTWKVKLIGNRS